MRHFVNEYEYTPDVQEESIGGMVTLALDKKGFREGTEEDFMSLLENMNK